MLLRVAYMLNIEDSRIGELKVGSCEPLGIRCGDGTRTTARYFGESGEAQRQCDASVRGKHLPCQVYCPPAVPVDASSGLRRTRIRIPAGVRKRDDPAVLPKGGVECAATPADAPRPSAASLISRRL